MAEPPTINWATLGGRMREARTRTGLTRREAAKKAGYSSTSTLIRYENNEITVPHEAIVFRFAEAYQVSKLWLMHGRGEIYS